MTLTPTGRVLVAGVGNIFLRDDGFGPEVARRLAGSALPEGVRVVDYGIRGMHLAYDLLYGYDALVLVDTVPSRSRPGTVHVVRVGTEDLGGGELDAHGMDPVAVLSHLETLGGELPATFVVGCEPRDTGDGIGLTDEVQTAVEEAMAAVRDLLDRAAAPDRRVVTARGEEK